MWRSSAVGTSPGWLEATAGSVVVVVANLALRPVARRIERLPVDASTEVETAYRLDVSCREDQEAHVRALLLQSLSGGGFTLQSLHSEDLAAPGRVRVSAELIAAGRVDSQLEQAVNRLSLEPGVTAVRWQAAERAET
jgi:putative Mg2+ transporter-C (MgtC) family protein